MRARNRKPETERALVAASYCMTSGWEWVADRDTLRRTRNQLMRELYAGGYSARDIASLADLRIETVYRITRGARNA